MIKATITALLSAALTFAGGCHQRPKPKPMEREVQRLHELTIPTDARALHDTGIERTSRAVTAAWEFETTWTWKEYTAWTQSGMPMDYRLVETTNVSSVLFRRNLPGDVLTLHIENLATNRVRVTFEAYPD